MNQVIYFDNAATAGTRPESVIEAVCRCMRDTSANPGRSAHSLSMRAAQIVYRTREALAQFFHFPDTENIVLSKNATEALNMVIYGVLIPGDRVITTSAEHNSVLRPLKHLEETRQIDLAILQAEVSGIIMPESLRKTLTKRTRLVVVNAATNVTGAIQNLEQIWQICRDSDTLLLVDAAQGAGAMIIDWQKTPVDFLAITGHKHLLAPQGTGALFVKNIESLPAFLRGGTGSLSQDIIHPDFAPDKFEAGTPNVPALAGWNAALEFIENQGIDNIITQEHQLTQYLINGLRNIDEIVVYAPEIERTATVSFNIPGVNPDEIAHYLDRSRQICCRPGLHCAPEFHKTMNTFSGGSVRFSLSFFNRKKEIDIALDALKNFIRNCVV